MRRSAAARTYGAVLGSGGLGQRRPRGGGCGSASVPSDRAQHRPRSRRRPPTSPAPRGSARLPAYPRLPRKPRPRSTRPRRPPALRPPPPASAPIPRHPAIDLDYIPLPRAEPSAPEPRRFQSPPPPPASQRPSPRMPPPPRSRSPRPPTRRRGAALPPHATPDRSSRDRVRGYWPAGWALAAHCPRQFAFWTRAAGPRRRAMPDHLEGRRRRCRRPTGRPSWPAPHQPRRTLAAPSDRHHCPPAHQPAGSPISRPPARQPAPPVSGPDRVELAGSRRSSAATGAAPHHDPWATTSSHLRPRTNRDSSRIASPPPGPLRSFALHHVPRRVRQS